MRRFWLTATALAALTLLTGAYSPDAVNTVDNNAKLGNVPSTAAPYVMRMGFAAPGDAPPLMFVASTSACSLNAGNGDGGSQVKSLDGRCWIAQFPVDGLDPRQFGAASTATGTANLAAFQATRDTGIRLGMGIVLPPQNFTISNTIDFYRVPVKGARPAAQGFPTSYGSTITCPATIAAVCVNSGDYTNVTANMVGGQLSDLIVTYSGTPVAGDTAIRFIGYNVKCTDIVAVNAWDGIRFGSYADAPAGLSAHCVRPATAKIYNDHIVQDSMPEVYITDGRFGSNGTLDVTGRAYISVTGTDPNGLIVSHSQFNLGQNFVSKFLYFHNLASQSNGIYKFTDTYVERVQDAIIDSDGTGSCLRCQFSSFTTNADSATFFSASLPSLNTSIFANMYLIINSLNLPNVTHLGVTLSDVQLQGSTTGTGNMAIRGTGELTVGNVASLTGTIDVGGTNWTALKLSNLNGRNGYIDTATGNVYAANVPHLAWTPQLAFGGAHVGMTQASQRGAWWRNPDGMLTMEYGITLTAKGSSVGTATIAGPFSCRADGYGGYGAPQLIIANNMAGMSGTPASFASQGSNTILFINGSGAILTDANFTNTTILSGSAVCQAP